MNQTQYFFYETSTGRLIQTGQCIPADIDLQVPPSGCTQGVGAADLFSEYYSITDSAIKPYPLRPSQYHQFDFATESWVSTAEDLEAAKADKNAEVNAWRASAMLAPIEFNGALFDADEQAIKNISAVLLMAVVTGNSSAITWRDFNNVDHELALAELQSLAAAIQTRTEALYTASWAHKANVGALQSVAEVLAYNVQTS